jgi:hypothetical protein
MYKWLLTSLTVAFALAGLAVAVPVATAGQSQQATIRERLGEIGAWAVPSTSAQTEVSRPLAGQSQQAIIRERLGEIGLKSRGRWPASRIRESLGEIGLSSRGRWPASRIRETFGEIGAWAVPSTSAQTDVSRSPVRTPSVVSSVGFDWNDAGIGAAFAFGIVLLGAASLVTIRRRHGPVTH